ncbi:MAG: class I mannose-6-phosphate isomerase, partial [Bacteroidales bacterium]|nr:class I mannose-6-phosphate isomerase [Bacteroidales bacterium]
MLYPLKFTPIIKERPWGGHRLAEQLGKPNPQGIDRCGESWEIADMGNTQSVVANGFLAGNTLHELAEVYMGDLLGDRVFERYGTNFPLLVKLIDAHDDLSIQVHPDDATARKLHGSPGKTEMWYVMQAEADASLISGFNRELSRSELRQHIAQGTLPQVLHREAVAPGDALFIPAGRVHAIGRGVLLAEIQQAADITYRLFDYNRPDQHGQLRQLHIEQALEVLDLHPSPTAKLPAPAPNAPLLSCPHFSINRLRL